MSISTRFKSLYGRAALIAFLTLLLLLPFGQVGSLIGEREGLQQQARAGIAAIHGGAQTVGGPMLRVPTEVLVEEWNADLKQNVARWRAGPPRWLLPANLKVTARQTLRTEVRGIYSLGVYTLPDLDLQGEFPANALSSLVPDPERERALWSQASVVLPLGALSSLQAVNASQLAGRTLVLGSGSYGDHPALAAPLDLTPLVTAGRLPFHFGFNMRGSGSLHFLPLAGATEVKVRSAWPHPRFEGPFAAEHSEPDAQGFEASWRILEINRELPRSWSGQGVKSEALFSHAFGFSLLTPVDVYSMSYRAARYGILFIAITFLVFFAWEQLTPSLRLHGMHYLLVGLALSVFFLLLIALGEHLVFAQAYVLAAGALVTLLAIYVAGVTSNRRAGMAIGAGLAACYGCLYLILQSEDYALLLGSLLVFGVLAATMLATRRLQWGQSPGY